jgi:hypothetical protein
MSSASIQDYQMAKPPAWAAGLKADLERQIAEKLDKERQILVRQDYNYDLNSNGATFKLRFQVTSFNPIGSKPPKTQYILTLYGT